MEMYVKIREVLPIATRNYEDKNGQPQVFKSKGFVLQNGNNAFYCEAKNKYAETLELRQFDLTQWHVADFNISTRKYAGNDGRDRFSNEVELQRLNIV